MSSAQGESGQPYLKSACPLAWESLSFNVDGSHRVCCNTHHGAYNLDSRGNRVYLNESFDLESAYNSELLKKLRSEMMSGQKPEFCRSCYDIESAGGHSVRSDLVNHYGPRMHELVNQTANDGAVDVKIRYLDVQLSNKCNIQCQMCRPELSHGLKSYFEKSGRHYSSEWYERAQSTWVFEGAYRKLYEKIVPDLTDMLITGGEPFINETHYRMLEEAIRVGSAKNILLRYHSNMMSVPSRLIELWKNFRHIEVHMSLDGAPVVNEYVRYGSKWNRISENVSKLIQLKKEMSLQMEVHTTFQALTLYGLPDLIQILVEWGDEMPVLPHFIWLEHPNHLAIRALPLEARQRAKERIENYLVLAEPHFQSTRFSQHAQIKIQTLKSYLNLMMNEPVDENLTRELARHLREFDSIRGTSVEYSLPEIAEIIRPYLQLENQPDHLL